MPITEPPTDDAVLDSRRSGDSPRLRLAILGSRGYPSTYGGFETFIRRLAPWLAARGHDVTVYGRSDGRTRSLVTDGVRVIDTIGSNSKNLSTVSHGITGALNSARRKHDVALVLNVANGPALPILRAGRIPTVVNVDGIEWERAKWGLLARTAFKVGAHTSARLANTLVADSQAIASIWEEKFRKRPIFIPYGADVVESAGHDRLHALGLTPSNYVLVVARLVPENNVELALDALELLDWSQPAVVVGSANYDNPIVTRLRNLHESGRITWLGHVHDQELLGELWGNAGLYFHGHSVGGTNPALLQALGHGAPTIALATTFNYEVLGTQEQLVEGSPEVVAQAITDLLSNSPRRAQYAEHGRQIVRERYSWSQVLASYENELMRASQCETSVGD